MNPINQSEINDILWRACDTFRGTVDPAEYKNYILVMLFVKYISDVWRDRYDQLTQLCHLQEPNHTPRFYELLDRVLPDWRERRERLNSFEFG